MYKVELYTREKYIVYSIDKSTRNILKASKNKAKIKFLTRIVFRLKTIKTKEKQANTRYQEDKKIKDTVNIVDFTEIKTLLTVKEVCKYINLKETATRKLIREKRLQSCKIGGKILVDLVDLNKFIEKCKVK